ncbi:MAG TPA: DoxX family protein [Candidatus Limnocylindria bacterium]|nr:DoxX family protein [Candidatus Limnocylindria bacterium]
MTKIQSCKTWLRAHEDLFMDVVRIYLGCGLFVKAIFLMTHRDYLMQMIADSGNNWFTPALIAQYVILAHLFGGAMLALGLATRVAAFAQLPVLLGAVFSLYLPRFASVEPRQYLEYAGLVAFLLALLGVFGAGRFSLDYVMARKWREMRSHAQMPATSEAH